MGSKSGFTLLEILVVIMIVGALAAVAMPSYTIHIEKVRASEGVQTLTALLASQKRYQLENSAYATALSQLDVDVAASNNFAAPTVANNASALASIQRANDANIPYILTMNDTGTVTCACTGCSPSNICGRIGY